MSKALFAYIIIISGFITKLYSQSKTILEFKQGLNQTLFRLNKDDKSYDKSWEELTLKYKSQTGYSLSLGLNRSVKKNLSIGFDLRYSKWGGEIYAIKDDPTFYINFLIDYYSLSLPVFVDINIYSSNKSSMTSKIGIGFDYTFYTSYRGENYFNTSKTQSFKIDQYNKYWVIGLTYHRILNDGVSLLIAAELNNDYFMGNSRKQNFMGFFKHDAIPINYSLLLIQTGIRINF